MSYCEAASSEFERGGAIKRAFRIRGSVQDRLTLTFTKQALRAPQPSPSPNTLYLSLDPANGYLLCPSADRVRAHPNGKFGKSDILCRIYP